MAAKRTITLGRVFGVPVGMSVWAPLVTAIVAVVGAADFAPGGWGQRFLQALAVVVVLDLIVLMQDIVRESVYARVPHPVDVEVVGGGFPDLAPRVSLVDPRTIAMADVAGQLALVIALQATAVAAYWLPMPNQVFDVLNLAAFLMVIDFVLRLVPLGGTPGGRFAALAMSRDGRTPADASRTVFTLSPMLAVLLFVGALLVWLNGFGYLVVWVIAARAFVELMVAADFRRTGAGLLVARGGEPERP